MAASRQRVHSRGAHDSHLWLEMVPFSHLFRSSLLPFTPSLCLRLTSERFLRSRLLRYPSSFAVCIDFPLCSDTSHLSLLGNALSRSNKLLAASLCAAYEAVLMILLLVSGSIYGGLFSIGYGFSISWETTSRQKASQLSTTGASLINLRRVHVLAVFSPHGTLPSPGYPRTSSNFFLATTPKPCSDLITTSRKRQFTWASILYSAYAPWC